MTDTLRDRLAAAIHGLGSGALPEEQADAVLNVLNQWDAERSQAGDTPWDEAVERVRSKFPHWIINVIPQLSSELLYEIQTEVNTVLDDRFNSGAFD